MANIDGTAGNDVLNGTEGPDLIRGLAGSDVINGLGGDDVYVVDNVGDSVTEVAAVGTDEIRTSLGADGALHLDDILARAAAPQFIHFMSLDVEGAELEALRAFPFDRYRVGAWTIEHNREEPKRSQIVALLAQHGYLRVNEWHQDDFFVPVDARH